ALGSRSPAAGRARTRRSRAADRSPAPPDADGTFAGDHLGLSPRAGLRELSFLTCPRPRRTPDQRSAKPGAADREPRRGGVQPRLLIAGSAGRNRPKAGEGDGRPPNRIGVPCLRAQSVHRVAFGGGSQTAGGL